VACIRRGIKVNMGLNISISSSVMHSPGSDKAGNYAWMNASSCDACEMVHRHDGAYNETWEKRCGLQRAQGLDG
jgi:hypothetical protein